MKYIFRFLWAVVFLFVACAGLIAIIDAPFQIAGYAVLAGAAYFGVGFHKLILVHYPKQIYLYQDDGKSFWLGWVLMLLPLLAFWHSYEIFASRQYLEDVSKARRGWLLDVATNWLGDTFGYGVPAAIYLMIGLFILTICIKLLKAR
jgi:hypothetical protein